MATTKITALSAVADGDISATDVLPLVDTAGTPTTYKVTLAQMRSALLAASGSGWTAADYVGMGAGTVPSSGMIRSGQGAITADSPLVNSTATWNNVAVTFRHMLVNVTDTASAAGSLLADWQVGGVTKFSVSKAGAVTSGTVNGQTISSAASFTGSVAVASGLTVGGSGVTVSAGGIAVNAGTTAVQALTATTVTTTGAIQLADAQQVQWAGSNNALRFTGTTFQLYPNGVLGFSVVAGGAGVFAGGLTVSAGGVAVTGNSTITGTLAGVTTFSATQLLVNTPGAGAEALRVNGAGVFAGSLTGVTNITASGTVTATTFIGALSGNASTATALQTARTINGTSFDGTANITVTAAAGTLTGATLNSSVTASSLTSVGVLASPHMTSPVIDSGGLSVTAGSIAVSSGNVTASGIVRADAQGMFGNYNGSGSLGYLSVSANTSGTATGGAASLPAAPQGFFLWTLGTTTVKIPYYNA